MVLVLQLLQLAVVLQLLLLVVVVVVLHLLKLSVLPAKVLMRVLQLMALVVWRRRGGCLRDVRERPYRRC